jgi:hypothetical protein
MAGLWMRWIIIGVSAGCLLIADMTRELLLAMLPSRREQKFPTVSAFENSPNL